MEANGAWTTVSSTTLRTGITSAEFDVGGILETDETGLISVAAARLRIELLDATGKVVSWTDVPVNVDCPQQFCGLAMVGKLLLRAS